MRARAFGGVAALLAVTACGSEPTNSSTPDIGNAASAAQADIDSYAANAGAAFTPPTAPSPRPPSERPQAITPESALGADAGGVGTNGVAAEPRHDALEASGNATGRE